MIRLIHKQRCFTAETDDANLCRNTKFSQKKFQQFFVPRKLKLSVDTHVRSKTSDILTTLANNRSGNLYGEQNVTCVIYSEIFSVFPR